MSPTQQRRAALVLANEKRHAVNDLRRRIASENGALEDVLMNPPAELERWPVIDVVRLAYSKRSGPSLMRLGRLAVRDGVNLMMPLGEASMRTRQWTAEHAMWHWQTSGRVVRRRVLVAEAEVV